MAAHSTPAWPLLAVSVCFPGKKIEVIGPALPGRCYGCIKLFANLCEKAFNTKVIPTFGMGIQNSPAIVNEMSTFSALCEALGILLEFTKSMLEPIPLKYSTLHNMPSHYRLRSSLDLVCELFCAQYFMFLVSCYR